MLESWRLRLPLLGIAAWATWHITSLRTLTAEMRAEIERHGTHTDPSTVPGMDANAAGDDVTLS